MKIINDLLLLQFIQEHKISTSFQEFIKKSHHSAISNLDIFHLAQLQDLAQKINMREAKKDADDLCQQPEALLPWKKGEFKLFLWVIVYYSFIFKVEIPSFNEKDYQLIQSIFCRQSIKRLKYEVFCLFPPKETFKSVWEETQISLFDGIIRAYLLSNKKMQWKAISYELFISSQGKFFKTNAQCRERWLNHANPQVKKKSWSRQEDYQLMISIQRYGLKWAQVSKSFKGSRTEHMVKNRYLSLMNKWKKNKVRKNNKEIELKIIKTIKRNIQRTFNQTLQDSENNIIPEAEKKVKEGSINQGDEGVFHTLTQSQEIKESFESNLQELPMPFLVINAPETQSEPSVSKLPEFRFIELGHNRYNDQCLKQTIADIVLKLGCSHPEQIDMFFQSHDDWMIEAEEF